MSFLGAWLYTEKNEMGDDGLEYNVSRILHQTISLEIV